MTIPILASATSSADLAAKIQAHIWFLIKGGASNTQMNTKLAIYSPSDVTTAITALVNSGKITSS